MISAILRLFVLILIPVSVTAQNLQVSVTSATSEHGSSTFQLQDNKVSVSEEGIAFPASGVQAGGFEAAGFSPDLSLAAVLNRNSGEGRALLFSSGGDTLNAISTMALSGDDPSFAVYPLDNGGVLIRNNITNFTFYNTFGEIETSMSSSSQSEEGELISEVAFSSDGSTLVIYNPKIRRNGDIGSQAQVRTSSDFENIYSSRDRHLKDVSVSDDGTVITLVTAKSGEDDVVIAMDRFGNELNTFISGEDLAGTSLSEDAEYITLYSRGRIQVYETLSGERIGSTSIRSPVFMAAYFPEDNIILALSGNYSENANVLNSVEFHAINIQQRSIARQDLSTGLHLHDRIIPELSRISANRYRLSGMNKHIDISASF